MKTMTHRSDLLVRLSIALLGCATLCGCAAYETSRVLSLDDVPASESVWRPRGDAPQPLFVETTAAIVAKRQLRTAMTVEPELEPYLQRTLEAELGIEIERLRVDYVGYRYAYYFPSRSDDFVLRVELDAPAAGIHGEFEGVILGRELDRAHELIGPDWRAEVPDTGAGNQAGEVDDQARAIERRADERAYLHRLILQIATQRLAESLAQPGAGRAR